MCISSGTSNGLHSIIIFSKSLNKQSSMLPGMELLITIKSLKSCISKSELYGIYSMKNEENSNFFPLNSDKVDKSSICDNILNKIALIL